MSTTQITAGTKPPRAPQTVAQTASVNPFSINRTTGRRAASSQAVMEVVDQAAQVGLSPHEWLSLGTCAEVNATRPTTPLTPQDWRDAVLSTVTNSSA